MRDTSPLPAPEKPLDALLAEVAVTALEGNPAAPVRHMTHDSRHVSVGGLFVAYKGVYEDVHRYIPDAIARGARVVVAEQPPAALREAFGIDPGITLVQVSDPRLARGLMASALYDHPSRDLIVVGVTGTDGKTTTSTLIHAIWTAAGGNPGLISTVEARIGHRTLDTGLHVTTPEPEDLQGYLAAMRRAGCDVAVLEVTSHGLAQHRVAGVAFDMGVITNITHEALEFHGSFEAYVEAKAMLFRMLAEAPVQGRIKPTAVLNAADGSYQKLAAIPVPVTVTYSLTGEADYRAAGIEHDAAGLKFTALTPQGDVDVRSPLLGAYNAANILAAMAATGQLGATPEAWRGGVEAVQGVPGRMEVVDEGQGFVAIVDFAHTPNGLRHALTAARELTDPGGRVVTVFGCAGLRDPSKRAKMGRIAGDLADLAIVTAEDPRTEDLGEILQAIEAGLRDAGARPGDDYRLVPDRADAIAAAVVAARPGDAVIVCGKGHEQSMAIGTEERPWDDRQALRAALRSAYW